MQDRDVAFPRTQTKMFHDFADIASYAALPESLDAGALLSYDAPNPTFGTPAVPQVVEAPPFPQKNKVRRTQHMRPKQLPFLLFFQNLTGSWPFLNARATTQKGSGCVLLTNRPTLF